MVKLTLASSQFIWRFIWKRLIVYFIINNIKMCVYIYIYIYIGKKISPEKSPREGSVLGLDLECGGFFPGEFFPRTIYIYTYYVLMHVTVFLLLSHDLSINFFVWTPFIFPDISSYQLNVSLNIILETRDWTSGVNLNNPVYKVLLLLLVLFSEHVFIWDAVCDLVPFVQFKKRWSLQLY